MQFEEFLALFDDNAPGAEVAPIPVLEGPALCRRKEAARICATVSDNTRGPVPAVYLEGVAPKNTQYFVNLLCIRKDPSVHFPGLFPDAADTFASVCNEWIKAHLDSYQYQAIMDRALECTKRITLKPADGEPYSLYDAVIKSVEGAAASCLNKHLVYSLSLYRSELSGVLSAIRKSLDPIVLRQAVGAYVNAVYAYYAFLCREVEEIFNRAPATRPTVDLARNEDANAHVIKRAQALSAYARAAELVTACLDQGAMDSLDSAAKIFHSRRIAERFLRVTAENPTLAIAGSLLWTPELLSPSDSVVTTIPDCMAIADRMLPRSLPRYAGGYLENQFKREEFSCDGAMPLTREFAIAKRAGEAASDAPNPFPVSYSYGSLYFALTGFVPPNNAGISPALVERLRSEFGVTEIQAHELAAAALTADNMPVDAASDELTLDTDILEYERELLQESCLDAAPEQPAADAPVAALQDQCSALAKEVRDLRERNKKLKDAWHEEARKANRAEDIAKNEKQRADQDRAELVSLREAIYTLGQQDNSDPPAEKTTAFPVHTTRTIRVYGGHDSFLRAIRAKLPDVQFLGRSFSNYDAIKGSDIIWMQVNAMSHPLFHGVVDIAKQYRIPVRYFTSASATKCALQILEEESLAEDCL